MNDIKSFRFFSFCCSKCWWKWKKTLQACFSIVIDSQDQFSYGCCAINGQIGRQVFTNRQMWHWEPFRGAALTKRGSYQLLAPNASADVIYRSLSAVLRETKRRGGPLTSPRAAFILTPPLPAAHLSQRLKAPSFSDESWRTECIYWPILEKSDCGPLVANS